MRRAAESKGGTTERYEIRVRGRVSEETASVFEGLALDVRPVETVLHGEVADQAALHGILDRVQVLGLELLEVRQLPQGAGAGPQPLHRPRDQTKHRSTI